MPAPLATVPQKVKEVQGLIEQMKPQLMDVLPRHMKPERIIRLCRAMVTKRQKLSQCTPISLLGAIVECSTLGLEPETPLGHAWILPFKDQAQMIIGYQGYIDLAYRSGKVDWITAEVVYANDPFDMQLGTRHELHHSPAIGDRGEPVGVYAVCKIKDGGTTFKHLTKVQVMKYKAMAPAANSNDSPWNSSNIEIQLDMWKKTAVRRLQKYIPKSTELARAIALDEQADMGTKQDYQVYIDTECKPIDNPAKQLAGDLHNRIDNAKPVPIVGPNTQAPSVPPAPSTTVNNIQSWPLRGLAQLPVGSKFSTVGTIAYIAERTHHNKLRTEIQIFDGTIQHDFCREGPKPTWCTIGDMVEVVGEVKEYHKKPIYFINEWRLSDSITPH